MLSVIFEAPGMEVIKQMGICWYCYWGWPSDTADIYYKAVNRLQGDESPLHFGPSHIVWEDENFEDHHIEWCLGQFDEYKDDYSESDLSAIRWSLEELLKIPRPLRCPQPDDYDGEHPELYPPPKEIVMVKV
ncbi:MAG: hypothetical protein SVK08_00660 [Halobacteriota archaeon]|nr:hypothetical protein [Halobacteriota archaeon]